MHKANSHDTRQPGGAAAAAAAARAGGRIRTGRSSSRPGGRCSVCQSAPSACAARARSGAAKRGGAGKRGAVVAAAAAAARAGGRIRTGRSSDHLGGRCSVCQSAPSVRSSSAVRCTGKRGGAGKRGGSSAVRCTGKRGGAGKRGGGGEQASGPRAARRTGDRQAGDGPESDRAQRSEKTSRSSLGRS